MRRSLRSRVVEEPVDLASGEVDAAPAGRGRAKVWRAILALLVVIAVLAAAYLTPLPSIGRVREWSDAMGPWFPLVFFVAYAVATIGPVPRTPFTVMAGVLFGPAVGFTGSMIASTIAAVVAFGLARRLGRARVQRHLDRAVFQALEERLERRGWLAVGSLRLIPVCPFSVLNYASGLSSVRPIPYTVASVLGTMPGTAAVVFLGEAVAGEAGGGTVVLSGALFAVGVIGLIVDTRLPLHRSSEKA